MAGEGDVMLEFKNLGNILDVQENESDTSIYVHILSYQFSYIVESNIRGWLIESATTSGHWPSQEDKT